MLHRSTAQNLQFRVQWKSFEWQSTIAQCKVTFNGRNWTTTLDAFSSTLSFLLTYIYFLQSLFLTSSLSNVGGWKVRQTHRAFGTNVKTFSLLHLGFFFTYSTKAFFSSTFLHKFFITRSFNLHDTKVKRVTSNTFRSTKGRKREILIIL